MIIDFRNCVGRVVGVYKFLLTSKRKVGNIHFKIHIILSMLLPVLSLGFKSRNKKDNKNQIFFQNNSDRFSFLSIRTPFSVFKSDATSTLGSCSKSKKILFSKQWSKNFSFSFKDKSGLTS